MAEHLRGELTRSVAGPWFRSAGAGKDLVELWSTGSSVPLETRVTRLGAALTSFWQRSIEVTRVGLPVDGGVVIAPFPQPKGPVEPTVWTARPWPHARIGPRGAIDAGPPPDARWIPKPWPTGGKRIAPEDAGVSVSP